MRKSTLVFILLLWLQSPGVVFSQQLFTNYSMGGPNSAAFTTNNFKCIGIGKDNRIWAGTQYGGLYTYDDNGQNIWLKSDKLTNVFINDIKHDGDSGIWIAQSGQASVGGNSNIAGGVNYFPVASDISMSFYSVQGTTTSADLLSRNVRSIYADKSYGTANSRLPRIWAAQGTYITSFNTRRGGLSVGLNPFATYFNNYSSGYATGTTATPISEAVGGNSQEVWIGVRQNNGGSQILRYKPNGAYIGIHGTADTSLFQAGFTAQAIHFDNDGNRWIGLRQGGLIIKTPDSWLKMDAPSFFPSGTQVNNNAIASDEYGNVYIGTTTGLLEYESRDYNPLSSPDYTPSYTLYTTNDGLPSNNITGVAYDAKNRRMLLTSDAGVTFMNTRPEFIEGVVFDVFCDLDNENKKRSGLQKIPLTSGVTVKLLRNNVEEESTVPNAFGIFELREANETDVYTVEIRFVREGRTMVYRYDNIRNHTRMKPVLMPHSLIAELKTFKGKMEARCFPVKISFDIQLDNLICDEAFDVTGYDLAMDHFYDAGGINADHDKLVYNLASYYTAMATVYKLGGNAVDLSTDAVANLFDAVDAMRSTLELSYSMKFPGTGTAAEKLDESYVTLAISSLKLLKEGLVATLKFAASKIGLEKDTQAIIDRCIGGLNEVLDVLIEGAENGRFQGQLKVVLDNVKKIMSVAAALEYYRESYARERHANFVYESSNSARYATSPHTFDHVFDNLYNPSANSIAKYANDTLTNRKAQITNFTNVAKYVDMAATGLEGASAMATILGGPAAAVILKGFALAAKGAKAGALASAMYQGIIGTIETAELSDNITPRAGLLRPQPGDPGYVPVVLQNNPDSLIAIKNRFNDKLAVLQAIYTAPVYDSLSYFSTYRQLRREDSLYTREMVNTINTLWASVDTAMANVPGFSNRLGKVIDSFVSKQYMLRHALKFQNMGYYLDTDKSVHAGSLDSLATELKITNDSAVNGIIHLISIINSNSITAQAYLQQERYQINHSRVPGSAGTITYTFKNYGGVAMNNTSFKISEPTGGYAISGADSVYIGTIPAGQSRQVSFAFTSPTQDSIGHYSIDVKAANGFYEDVYGSFYVIDPAKYYSVKNGNWNDPSTWSANAVPGAANKVYISHNVTVTTDVTCREVNINKPGNVQVNTGRRIIITN